MLIQNTETTDFSMYVCDDNILKQNTCISYLMNHRGKSYSNV